MARQPEAQQPAMALKRKGPLSVLWSRPVLIFVPVLALMGFAFQQADRESVRFQECVAAGVTSQRAHLCMDSAAAQEALMLDAYGYPYWLMPGAPERQVDEAVGALCRVFSRGRDGVGRTDCACALEEMRAGLPEAEFAVLAQSLETHPEGDVVVSIRADLSTRLEALLADPEATAPADIDGTPVSLPAGFEFATVVADQWRRLVGDIVALDAQAPDRISAGFTGALDACVAN